MTDKLAEMEFKPVTGSVWPDMEELFDHLGANKGCWCMWWRLKRREFDHMYGAGNHRAMEEIVASGRVPGILAYRDNVPVGWCSVAPRIDFPVLDRSPVLKRVDDQPVWSIVCFFVLKELRGQGMMSALIESAVKYAAENEAGIVEAYPIIPENSQDPETQSYTGVYSVFERLGFVEVARRSKIRPVMRLFLENGR